MPRLPILLRTWPAAVAVLIAGCEIHVQPIESQPPASATAGGQTLSLPSGGSAGQMAFIEGFEQGMEAARAQQKPLLLFFTAEWCKYCHQMQRETFAQQAVVDLSREFVCVLIDADAEANVCRQFEVRGFPTIQFVSARGLRLNRVTGKQPAGQLLAQMKAALQAVARREPPTLQR